MCQLYDINEEKQKRNLKPLHQGQLDALKRYNALGIKMWLTENRRLTGLECTMSILGLTAPAEKTPIKVMSREDYEMGGFALTELESKRMGKGI